MAALAGAVALGLPPEWDALACTLVVVLAALVALDAAGAPARYAVVPAAAGLGWAVAAWWSEDPPAVPVALAVAGVATAGVLAVVVPRWWTVWWLVAALAAGTAAFVLPVVAYDDGRLRWDDGPALVALAIGASVIAALAASRWLDWGWFWTLAWVTACVAVLVGRAGEDLHRLATVALIAVVLLRVARNFSKTTMRAVVLVAIVVVVATLARIGQNNAPEDVTGLHELVVEGADTTLQDALRPVVGDDVTAALGPWGWGVVGLALLLGYRHLEVLNNRRYGSPVVTKGATELEAEFLERVRSMHLPAASPTPGGATGVELVNILKEGSGNPTTGPVMQAIRAAWAVVFPVPGVTAELATAPEGRKASGPMSVTVTLSTTYQGRFLASYTTHERPRAAALEEAADFVALNALTYTKLCPPWECWVPDAVSALGAYRRVVDKTGRHRNVKPAQQIKELEKALHDSPCNGSVRTELANGYALAGRPMDALLQSVVAAREHERHIVARYRLVSSLSMAACFGYANGWNTASPAYRDRVIAAMRESGVDERTLDMLASVDQDPAAARTALLGLAGRHLGTLHRQLSYWRLLFAALRQSERAVWLRLARDTTLRCRMRDRVVTVRLIVKARQQIPGAWSTLTDKQKRRVRALLDRGDRLATRQHPGSYYNVACLYALVAHALGKRGRLDRTRGRSPLTKAEANRTAIELLGKALRAPGAQPSYEWMRQDPDLRHLWGKPEFGALGK